MTSTVLRGSAFRSAIPAAAAGRLSGVEGVAVVLRPSHSRRLHSSTRADLPPKSSLDEFLFPISLLGSSFISAATCSLFLVV